MVGDDRDGCEVAIVTIKYSEYYLKWVAGV
jgi:hypothetical protein